VSGCCSERGCTRKQPFLILQSPLSGRYYLVTRYYTDKHGHERVREHHDITEQVEAILKREREAKTSERRVDRVPQPEGGFIELDDDA
jgi:hypothetical protein